jgi:hypothetical protein
MGASFTVELPYLYKGLVSADTVSTQGTISSGQGLVYRGTVLESAAGSNIYIKAATAAAAVAILAEDVDATAAAVKATVIIGGRVKANAIAAGALDHSAVRDALRAHGILVETVLDITGQIVKGSATAAPLSAPQVIAGEQPDEETNEALDERAAEAEEKQQAENEKLVEKDEADKEEAQRQNEVLRQTAQRRREEEQREADEAAEKRRQNEEGAK